MHLLIVLSITEKSVEVPDSFYDENLESEKEFLEIATTLSEGKLENVTNVKVRSYPFSTCHP